VGYGAWAIGGPGWQFAWGQQNDADSIAAIHRSLELGVHWIDTAAVYGFGRSEEVVTQALKSWRGPRPYVLPNAAASGMKRAYCTETCAPIPSSAKIEASLRRLGMDEIDLYQIH
jgi:aryl-alcohol dehydrogenase-like predicted oxidoreductase